MQHKQNLKSIGFATLAYAMLFFCTLFLQCMIFHYLAFKEYVGSSIIHDPILFWSFYLPKISICLFASVFVFLFPKKRWTIVVSVILALWIWAELIYYRINGFFLDAYSLSMVGNMKGFWSSVLAFIHPSDIVIAIPTLVLLLFLILLKPQSTSGWSAVAVFVLSIVLHIVGTLSFDAKIERDAILYDDLESKPGMTFNPFSKKGVAFFGCSPRGYICKMSVLHCIALDVWNLIEIPFHTKPAAILENVVDSSPLFNPSGNNPAPKGNLYIILFESFENWSISPRTTPVIYEFINSHNNLLWAQKVIRQTKRGVSGDGQMIVNAGILPVSAGATCFRFPNNCYPSLSELFKKAALIQPGDLLVWNQKKMSDAYHISDNLLVPDKNDSTTFSILTDIYRDYSYVMAISTASHTPFLRCPDNMKLNRDSSMPKIMADYLDCVHYTDSLLGDFLEKVDTDETLRNSTIIITGDHTIFDDDLRRKFNDYFISSGEDKKAEAYCPFIIYSPSIKEKTIVEEEVYQMDIFPTALHAIGCDSTYYWKGFGINLLDRDAVRILTEEEAFALSEKMIEADYWKYIKDGDATR